MTLRITAKEEVVAIGEAPVVDKSGTSTGSNFSAKVMKKLPMGRNYATDVKLQPGVQEDTGDRQGQPTAQSVRNWVGQMDVDEGRRNDGLTSAEKGSLAAAA